MTTGAGATGVATGVATGATTDGTTGARVGFVGFNLVSGLANIFGAGFLRAEGSGEREFVNLVKG